MKSRAGAANCGDSKSTFVCQLINFSVQHRSRACANRLSGYCVGLMQLTSDAANARWLYSGKRVIQSDSTHIVRQSDFGEQVLNALKQWKWKPTRNAGTTVDNEQQFRFNFVVQ